MKRQSAQHVDFSDRLETFRKAAVDVRLFSHSGYLPKYESKAMAKVAAFSARLISSYFVIDITSPLRGEADNRLS